MSPKLTIASRRVRNYDRVIEQMKKSKFTLDAECCTYADLTGGFAPKVDGALAIVRTFMSAEDDVPSLMHRVHGWVNDQRWECEGIDFAVLSVISQMFRSKKVVRRLEKARVFERAVERHPSSGVAHVQQRAPYLVLAT